MHLVHQMGGTVSSPQMGAVGAPNSQADESGQVVQHVGQRAGRAALLPQGQVGLLQLGRGTPQQGIPQAGAGLQSLQPPEGCQSLTTSTQSGKVPTVGLVGGHFLQPGMPWGESTG